MPTPNSQPNFDLFDAACKEPKVAIQIFSTDAMQDPKTTMVEKANNEIAKYGFTLWYCGMPSLQPADLWEYRNQGHKNAYLCLVRNAQAKRGTYDPTKVVQVTTYSGPDGQWEIPFYQNVNKGAKIRRAFKIDKLQLFSQPLVIQDTWFQTFFSDKQRDRSLLSNYTFRNGKWQKVLLARRIAIGSE